MRNFARLSIYRRAIDKVKVRGQFEPLELEGLLERIKSEEGRALEEHRPCIPCPKRLFQPWSYQEHVTNDEKYRWLLRERAPLPNEGARVFDPTFCAPESNPTLDAVDDEAMPSTPSSSTKPAAQVDLSEFAPDHEIDLRSDSSDTSLEESGEDAGEADFNTLSIE